MAIQHEIKIVSEQKTLRANHGASLLYALTANGIILRSDCGGIGKCGKCAVKILRPTRKPGRHFENVPNDKETVSNAMACELKVLSDLTIDIPEAAVLRPEVIRKPRLSEVLHQKLSSRAAYPLSSGKYGLAVDLGTTTIAMYLCDLKEKKILGSVSVKNPQSLFGDDVMSRISAVDQSPFLLKRMRRITVSALQWAADRLCESTEGVIASTIENVVVVGNPTMLHLFLAKDPTALGVCPYTPSFVETQIVSADSLFLKISPSASVTTVSLISGFLGADILAAALATDLETAPRGCVLADVGTNGEVMAVGAGEIGATSCATGPALEGATIKHGMQAITGAIDRVKIDPDTGFCTVTVIGASPQKKPPPRGICGSGVVSAVAELLRAGIILPDGRFNEKKALPNLFRDQEGLLQFILVPKEKSASRKHITLTQKDIRAVQLAKGAFRTGIDILCARMEIEKPERLIVAGAFGNYIDKFDAMDIGMFPPLPENKIIQAGNAAGEGAVLCLIFPDLIQKAEKLAGKTRVVDLATDPEFQDRFVKSLSFDLFKSSVSCYKARP